MAYGIIGKEHLLRRGYSPLQINKLEEIAKQEQRVVKVQQVGGSTHLVWSQRGGIGGIPFDAGAYEPHKQVGITGYFRQAPGQGGVWDIMSPDHVKTNLTDVAERTYVLPIWPASERMSIAFNPFQRPLGNHVSEGFVQKTGPNYTKLERIRVQGLTGEELVARQRLVSAELARGIPEKDVSVPWQFRPFIEPNPNIVYKPKIKKKPLDVSLFNFNHGFGLNFFNLFKKKDNGRI